MQIAVFSNTTFERLEVDKLILSPQWIREGREMTKVTATIQVEFETTDVNVAKAALTRLQGGVKHSIEFPVVGLRFTGLVPDSLVVNVMKMTIDDHAVP